ncbi:hypothetical protein Acr_01g0005960 [Actinidia rufa]|uniref:CBS domain-containing protein n=1 Tax=Actinidia rufa TaxID=165716 RepID=A0A7J0E550_9ERIC|nr:hypothetical protein Acr_01g0005960 [Actinidia rufa]
MAVRLLSYKIADLCLGKPPLRPLSASATVGDAVTALKASDDDCHVSIWSRDPLLDGPENDSSGEYLCVGKVCMADVICHLCKAENLSRLRRRLSSPPSLFFCSLKFRASSPLNFQSLVTTAWSLLQWGPFPALSPNKHPSLSWITTEFWFGEISPFTLACCDEIVTATITTLSVGDLIAYLDCGSPPKEIVRVVKTRMKEMDLKEMSEKVNFFDIPSNYYYSDEEFSSLASSLPRSSRYSRSCSVSARMRRAELVVCHPESSLAAVMVQAITHRVNYVWVIEEDYSVFGMVTFSNILKVLYEHLKSMA